MSPIASKYRRALRGKPTLAEAQFRKLLQTYKIHHQFQRLIYTPNRFFILDFVIKMRPFVIFEIDGSSHNGRRAYDNERTQLVLKQKGYTNYKLIRLTNSQVFNGEALNVLKGLYPRRFGISVVEQKIIVSPGRPVADRSFSTHYFASLKS